MAGDTQLLAFAKVRLAELVYMPKEQPTGRPSCSENNIRASRRLGSIASELEWQWLLCDRLCLQKP